MKHSNFVILVVYLFAVLQTKNVSAGTCKEMMDNLVASNMKMIRPCIEKLGYKTGDERADHFYCIMKCMLTEGGILASDGSISVIQGISFIISTIENEYIETALNEVAKCQHHAKGDLNNPEDQKCENFAPLVLCSVGFLLKLCG